MISQSGRRRTFEESSVFYCWEEGRVKGGLRALRRRLEGSVGKAVDGCRSAGVDRRAVGALCCFGGYVSYVPIISGAVSSIYHDRPPFSELGTRSEDYFQSMIYSYKNGSVFCYNEYVSSDAWMVKSHQTSI